MNILLHRLARNAFETARDAAVILMFVGTLLLWAALLGSPV